MKKFFDPAPPIAADGKVFFSSITGIISVIQAGDSFKVLARNKLLEPITATPAIDGIMKEANCAIRRGWSLCFK